MTVERAGAVPTVAQLTGSAAIDGTCFGLFFICDRKMMSRGDAARKWNCSPGTIDKYVI